MPSGLVPTGPRSVQALVHHVPEALEGDRLGYEGRATSNDLVLHLLVGAANDDGRACEQPFVLGEIEHLEPGNPGQTDVGDEQVACALPERLQPLGGVLSDGNVVLAGHEEDLGEHLARIWLVLDDDDA